MLKIELETKSFFFSFFHADLEFYMIYAPRIIFRHKNVKNGVTVVPSSGKIIKIICLNYYSYIYYIG